METTFKAAPRLNMEKAIAAYGLTRNFAVRTGPKIYIGTVLVLIAAITIIGQGQYSALLLSVSIFILGFQQWRAARDETAMDRFYERINLSNQKLENWPAAREMLTVAWKDNPAFQREMYVYVELDTLEYVIEKYKLGYMSEEHTLRGLENFKSRCLYSKEFRDLAFDNVRTSSYNPTTIAVVDQICQELKAAQKVPSSSQ